MNVLIHAHEFSASEQLSDFIHQKAAKLQQWFDHIVDVEIYLRAQLVEQLICNQLVGGSSPSSGSIVF
jgi:ribosome-associated translation inhibitor RaiA